MPLKIEEHASSVRAVYRQPLNSWGLFNTFFGPVLVGWLVFLLARSAQAWPAVLSAGAFLASSIVLLDRLFGRTRLTCASALLTIDHRLFFFCRSRAFSLLEMSEPYLTQEEWSKPGRIPWIFEKPSCMKFEYRGRKVSCCRRMTEVELWELLSAIRKNNHTIDRQWDSIPAPSSTDSGPLGL